MADDRFLFGDRPSVTTEGRQYMRRVILLEEAQVKLRAAVRAEQCALYHQARELERAALNLILEIGPEYLIIDERKR